MKDNTVIPKKVSMAFKPKNHKKNFSPPSPLPRDVSGDRESSEKIYISMVEEARQHDKHVATVEGVSSIDEKKEEEDTRIYINLNSVIKPTSNTIANKHIQPVLMRKKGHNQYRTSYRTTAIKGRCRQFAQDFYDNGFPIGVKVTKRELRYRMITLDLCHDKITVKQYFERLVMYGYFKILPNGMYEFRSLLPVGQQALPNSKTTMSRLDASLSPLPKQNRSW